MNAEKDPDGAKRFREWDPLVNFGAILPVGVPSAKGKWGTAGINLEITRANADPGLVYNIAKWFNENYARYTEGHPENQYRTLETLLEGLKHTYMPCHEGLITYLKELGVWTPAHDKRQAENIALVDRYIAEFRKVMTLADEKSIWVSPESPEWVEMWNDYKAKNIPPFILFEDLPA